MSEQSDKVIDKISEIVGKLEGEEGMAAKKLSESLTGADVEGNPVEELGRGGDDGAKDRKE